MANNIDLNSYYQKMLRTIPQKIGKEREKWINDFKVHIGCFKCGYNKIPEALHFHHIQGTKEKNISYLKGAPSSRVVEEIGKCIILCANCHIGWHKDEMAISKASKTVSFNLHK